MSSKSSPCPKNTGLRTNHTLGGAHLTRAETNIMTLERLYDILDVLRWHWHMAYENGNDLEADKIEALISMVNRKILSDFDQLSLTVYYQWK